MACPGRLIKSPQRAYVLLADTSKDEPLRNHATFQSGRWKALEKQKRNGTLSNEEEHLQTAKIREALLHILQDLPGEWASDGLENIYTSLDLPSMRNWKKYAAYITAAIALLAGIAEFSGDSLRDMFGQKAPTEQPATAFSPDSAPKASTQGDQSPALITHDGDVNIQ